MKNQLAALLGFALLAYDTSALAGGPTSLPMRSEWGYTVETNFGTTIAGLPFLGTTRYDFFSPRLTAPTSLASSDKAGGEIVMVNISPAGSNDVTVTGRMQYFDYDPVTETETLIGDTTSSGNKDVNHNQVVNWALPNKSLPASRVLQVGHSLHISMTVTLVRGTPGTNVWVLYNGTSDWSAVGLFPQNRLVAWNFGTPTPPPMTVSLTRLPDSTIRLTCVGSAGQAYLIQATTNLTAPAWTTIATANADTNGWLSFVDSDAASYACRFYRLATPY